MCELFAANLRTPQTLNAPLSTFFGDSHMHPHGWGLAVRDDAGNAQLLKAPERAIDSAILAQRLASPIHATHVLAHIRYATAGRLSYDNCHPFVNRDMTGREWCLVHNGSIFHQEPIAPFDGAAKGTSDSERLFLYLLDRLNKASADKRTAQDDARGLTDEERFDTLAQALADVSDGNKLNVVLDDGDCMYVRTNTEDDTLFYLRTPEGILICTRPLDARDWAALPKRQLIAFRAGEVVRISPAAGGLYHFDAQELRAFMLSHAA